MFGLDLAAVGVGALVSAALIPVLSMLLPNKVVHSFGVLVGKTASVFFRQRLGKAEGEKVEGYLQGSLQALVDGIHQGADADD